jgi:hypothetical protein
MLDLKPEEYQELVLMTGSKKELGRFLGCDARTLDQLWRQHQLKAPTDWFRAQPRDRQLELLALHRSTKKLASHLGASEASICQILNPTKTTAPSWSEDETLALFERYRSVRFVARMTGTTEAQVRKQVDELGLELTDLIDYSFGDHSNSKGRRAEVEWARREGAAILEDLNKTQGSQARSDFIHATLGRVNVKSSRRWKYKAQTRKGAPFFWKISSNGAENSDHFVAMCYDDRMKELVGIAVLPATGIQGKSTTLFEADLTKV